MGDLTGAVALRAARPEEAEALSALVLRSKAYWGYDEAFLAGCEESLRLRPADVVERRTVVAERVVWFLGVATLDGEPPDGELGLLFVEPDVIGSGVGRMLYRHVMDEATRLGFDRVTIESDPHAEPFHLAMGAERTSSGRALPQLVAWPVRPDPSWSVAWSEGGPAVHVGNVAEFNGQFTGQVRGPDHYSCLAALCGPRPSLIVLPQPVDDWWVRDVGAVLGWSEVEVHSGIAGDGHVSEAILARPDLLERLTSRGAPVLPWGRTTVFDPISPSPEGVVRAVRRYESKRQANALFRALAPEHPGIVVPEQRLVGSRRALVRELAAGKRVVLKEEYGVGGPGTVVASREGRRASARRWAARGLLVEEYVEGSGPYRDPTFDAVIDVDGEVHPVGVGLMDVDGTSYRGVTVGPGVLPDPLSDTAVGFGVAVGRTLSEEGYRGWYDVDFVTDGSGRLAPVEINLRLTGPAVAFHVQAALDRRRGGRHLVRTLDRLPLGAAIAARDRQALADAEAAVRDANAALGGMFADLEVSPRDGRGRRTRRAQPRRASR